MNIPMRRKEREVTDINEIAGILSRCQVIRVGINGEDGFPYVVPVSFGYELADNKITLYFHGARNGYKHILLAKNGNVCVEADIFYKNLISKGDATTEYESVIGFGTARPVPAEDIKHGLEILMTHCGFDGRVEGCMLTGAVALYKITLDSLTGKKNHPDADA